TGHAADDGDHRKTDGVLLRLWDTTTGEPVLQIEGDWHYSSSVSFSPDGKTVAVGTRGAGVRWWEAASGLERGRRQQGHRADVMALGFSPTGRLLATASLDHTALVWDLTGVGLDADGRLNPLALDDGQLATLWNDLASTDGRRAYETVWKLVAANEKAVSF